VQDSENLYAVRRRAEKDYVVADWETSDKSPSSGRRRPISGN
jgi:hypothetical protein